MTNEMREWTKEEIEKLRCECNLFYADSIRVAKWIQENISNRTAELARKNEELENTLSKIKARNVINAIKNICPECGHNKTEDGCPHCLATAASGLREIVEGVKSVRWEHEGLRFKDTKEWAVFYVALNKITQPQTDKESEG